MIQRELRNRKVFLRDLSGTKKYCFGNVIMERERCKPGDRFSEICQIHIPDFFEKVENEQKMNSRTNSVDGNQYVVFEDDHLLIINKPSGICCQVLFDRFSHD